MRTLREVEESPGARVVVSALCRYEALAIETGLVPTITSLHRRCPVVGGMILAALAWHFFGPNKGA